VLIGGVPVGHVTTGMKAPTVDKFVGMAYVPAEQSALGTEISIEVRGQAKTAKIVKRPFYKPRYK
jgi:glycine cleavage system aminomethyltransferase T